MIEENCQFGLSTYLFWEKNCNGLVFHSFSESNPRSVRCLTCPKKKAKVSHDEEIGLSKVIGHHDLHGEA